MSLRLKDLKIGQNITLVRNGLTHSSYSPQNTYVSDDMIGETHFFKVTRIGTLYLYGQYVRFEEGEKKLTTFVDKVDPSEYVFFDGLREDLRKVYVDRKALR